ncbi:guanine nucleotide-binding protein subunit beta-2 [Copidosoma floridanum]|uniref:guanine nucleotide-binding protein subunit beta-2 n=1 Tax=Copidosoma floridanum TaxID=29053 RepID=UPI0006C98C82|nr:guanine nucleotide-binding protein subunit beta-2 [Copidosoma floridanum]
MGKDDAETTALKQELDDLIQKCKEDQKKMQDTTLEETCGSVSDPPKVKLTTKKNLKGHINKVNSVHFSGDSRHCVTGSLDGKLIIWDTWTGNKVQVIPLRSAWVMSVAFAPSGNFVACGGMDNACTVYDLNNRDASGTAKITREFLGYEGFLSSCRFLDDGRLITGSGDMKICIWDLEANKKTTDFPGHAGDIASLSLAPDNNTFLTGSVDRTCKLWDVREINNEKANQTFFGHEADVNSVCYHPSGHGFVTASEDKTARLWDLRSDQQIGSFKPPGNPGFTSSALSFSGRFMFCGTDEKDIHCFDTLKTTHNTVLTGHDNRVTSLSMSGTGMALVSCSWDMSVRVWV